jgi:hypothetical protein
MATPVAMVATGHTKVLRAVCGIGPSERDMGSLRLDDLGSAVSG